MRRIVRCFVTTFPPFFRSLLELGESLEHLGIST
jgi:hypothetical protein